MKNFVRLVQFAWRYRARFGLSIGCAAMVALLFFTELGAVYPLLHILFDSQNPKRWVSEKIASIENEIVILDARTLETRTALELAEKGQRVHDVLKTRYEALLEDYNAEGKEAAGARTPARRDGTQGERRPAVKNRPARARGSAAFGAPG